MLVWGRGRLPDLRGFWGAQRFDLGYTHYAPLERGHLRSRYSIDMSLLWSERQMKRNAGLRSLRVKFADAGVGSGRMPDLRGF